jgi:hypothetical protein
MLGPDVFFTMRMIPVDWCSSQSIEVHVINLTFENSSIFAHVYYHSIGRVISPSFVDIKAAFTYFQFRASYSHVNCNVRGFSLLKVHCMSQLDIVNLVFICVAAGSLFLR